MTDQPKLLGRLTRRPEFLFVRGGAYAARKTVVVQMRAHPEREDGIKVGFTATKKIGNAVIRNRAKRRLREVARATLPKLGQEGMDYVFIARNDTPHAPYEQLMQDVEAALRKLSKTSGKTDAITA